MKKILSLIAAVLIYPQISQGAECVNVPTCAEMGYTLTAPKGDGWICTACPTDPKKFSCSEKPCSRGSTSVSCGKLPKCWGGKSGDKDCFYCGRTVGMQGNLDGQGHSGSTYTSYMFSMNSLGWYTCDM